MEDTPIPKVKPGEDKDTFLSRCVPMLVGEGKKQEQAVAICYSLWENKDKKSMLTHAELTKMAIEDSKIFAQLDGSEGENLESSVRFLHVGKTEAEVIEKSVDGKTAPRMIVTGYATTTDLDRADERLTLDALIDIQKQIAAGTTTVFLNHQWHELPIGKIVDTKIEVGANPDVGRLKVSVELADDEDGKKIFKRIQQNILKGFSISFNMLKEFTRLVKDESNNLKEVIFERVKYLETSLVGLPCNPNAEVTGAYVKSLKQIFSGPERQDRNKSTDATVEQVSEITNKEKSMELTEAKVIELVMKAMDAREQTIAAQKAKVAEEEAKIQAEVEKRIKAAASTPPPTDNPIVVVQKQLGDLKAEIEKKLGEFSTSIAEIRVVKEHKGGVKEDKDLDAGGDSATDVTVEDVLKRPNTDVEKAVLLFKGYAKNDMLRKALDEIKKDAVAYETLQQAFLSYFNDQVDLNSKARFMAKEITAMEAEKEGDEGDEDENVETDVETKEEDEKE